MPNIDEVSITTPALKNNYITFGCFTNINKINKDVFNLIIKILETIPNSRIIFQSENFDDLDFKRYFLNIFPIQKIDKNRLIFFGHFLSRHDFLLKFNEIDIVIDTFPYNGHTTNLEATWMCVPVLTKNGDNFLSRCGVSINSILNLDELIYENDDDCLLKLKNLNDNYKNIQLIKEKIIKGKKTSLIFDYKKFTNNLSKEIYKIVEQKR
jgi:predicted O-linked N-acetylglucosamine transferase (SPINDLY family)